MRDPWCELLPGGFPKGLFLISQLRERLHYHHEAQWQCTFIYSPVHGGALSRPGGNIFQPERKEAEDVRY